VRLTSSSPNDTDTNADVRLTSPSPNDTDTDTNADVRLTSSSPNDTDTNADDKPLSKRQLARLTPAELHELTKTYRERADAFANADDPDFTRAAELYTYALAAEAASRYVDKSWTIAALYRGRAWCYSNMIPPRHREVVKDCETVLALAPQDPMAVLRRSIAVQELKATRVF